MEDGCVGEMLVGCVGAGFDVGYLFDNVLVWCQLRVSWGGCMGVWGVVTRLWARNAVRRGWARRVSWSGRDWKMVLSQGACFMKFAAVEPKKQPSRLARSKSGRSIGFC